MGIEKNQWCLEADRKCNFTYIIKCSQLKFQPKILFSEMREKNPDFTINFQRSFWPLRTV
jgi:hypothetical protein